MKRNHWLIVAACGAVALVGGIIMATMNAVKEYHQNQSPDHMEKMRKAKAEKAAKEAEKAEKSNTDDNGSKETDD